MNYVCKKCGSRKVIIAQRGVRTSVRCGNCAAFICFIKEVSDIMEVQNELLKRNADRDVVAKQFVKNQFGTFIYCPECKCQLFGSNAPDPIGQFNLVDAEYCPKCGVKFV